MEFWWQRCLSRPYLRGHTQPLENVLSNVMWRTAKKDVLDQVTYNFVQSVSRIKNIEAR